MERRQRKFAKNASQFILIVFIAVITTIAGVAAFVLFEHEKPQISLVDDIDVIGSKLEVSLKVTDAKSGLRSVKAILKQGKNEKELFSNSYPRSGYFGKIGPAEDKRTVLIEPRRLGFSDGPAEIQITASDYSLQGTFGGNVTVLNKNITIDTHPPKVDLLHSERIISPGGSGIVIYRLSKDNVSNSVQINNNFFKGYPLADKNAYIAYIALPYDAERIEISQIIAKDKAGNQAVVPFSISLQKVNQKSDQISIGDDFLSAKLPEFQQHYPEMTGDAKEKYLYVNNTIRQENNKKIFAACQTPSPERFWQGRFLRMPGSPRAGYADHRTYLYQGQPFDRQVHLGVDIAQTERSDVKAANNGKVIFADYLGIYGNTIIIDHGQGVFSLYSHLSEFKVTSGSMVSEGQLIAKTGHTGMAGGDHLHFSMLVHGIFVTPVEWWDPHWIGVTIDEPIKAIK